MKTLNELHQWMEDNEYFELANELAVTRYKAMMWDKYNREARIHKDLLQAIDVTSDAQEFREILEENKRELQEFGGRESNHIDPFAAEGGGLVKGTLQDRYDWIDEEYRSAAGEHLADSIDSILNPHAGDRAFHDFEPATKEFEQHKDASGQTYTGHDDEDLPGEARKGEN